MAKVMAVTHVMVDLGRQTLEHSLPCWLEKIRACAVYEPRNRTPLSTECERVYGEEDVARDCGKPLAAQSSPWPQLAGKWTPPSSCHKEMNTAHDLRESGGESFPRGS